MRGSQKKLIEKLKKEGYIRSERVERAMLEIDRSIFVPEKYLHKAYDDIPLPVGYGQTISAPSIVAYMTELLQLAEGLKVLEVGTGSGYQTAIIAYLVKEQGHVWSIERVRELSDMAREKLKEVDLLQYVTLVVGDGSIGFKEGQPYDRIIITAACPRIPSFVGEQLKEGGIAVLPVGGKYEQRLAVVYKHQDHELSIKYDISVLFVPLVGVEGFEAN
ncbi:MAG: protein-L-isoaspartate(D-aspartate) O-methyltransferase [Caldisphaeraceae archaeon]|nr:protein-L-isoaspartate(D-aspartate) O-methyltransferase [Caldisphaeraceae archaeon]